MRFDVVIVGARCAGAALAVHLRRAGLTVAVLDAAPLPSDQPMSTHLVQPPGMDELDTLGIGDRVRASSPALHACRFDLDGCAMVLRYDEGRAAHCLRRHVLDGLLQEAAVTAGAELRPESRVVGVLRAPSGRVVGVEVRRAGRTVERLAADLVVGADGRHSTIATLVGAREYLAYDGARATYWAYWRRPAGWDPHCFYNGFHGDDSHVLFPTDDDLVVIATAPPRARTAAWRGTHRESYLADIRAFAPFASLRDDDPVSAVRGLVKTRYFFRTAVGPGWALVGDAGHHKEFVIGLGISDALRDARNLADGVRAGTETALQRYWRRRDVDRIEIFRWGQELGRADRVTALERLVARRSAATPDIGRRFGAVIDGRLSPFALVPPARALRWVLGAAVRGDLCPLADLRRALVGGARAQLERQRLARRVPVPRAQSFWRSVMQGKTVDASRSSCPRRSTALGIARATAPSAVQSVAR